MSTKRLPAEWEPQDGILLAWPHEHSDWLPYLEEVEPVFVEIACRISRFEQVVIVAAEPGHVERLVQAAGAEMARIDIREIPSNDTWARDFGPITMLENGRPLLLDFGFNGWGLKFPADLDNRITRCLHQAGVFGDNRLQTVGLILEGGSIESDGRGTLLTTAECLLNANRNPHLSKNELEAALASLLGAERFLWLEHGYLAGDDTDSHVDTLVRLAPADTILYVACDDPDDEHYPELAAMAGDLRAFRTAEGRPYRLLPLPWPSAKYDEDGRRLPATYANFLILNGAVLVPVYNDEKDAQALEIIGQAFPGRAIIGIDCTPLILQHGSLHCVTMQLPQGVLK